MRFGIVGAHCNFGRIVGSQPVVVNCLWCLCVCVGGGGGGGGGGCLRGNAVSFLVDNAHFPLSLVFLRLCQQQF